MTRKVRALLSGESGSRAVREPLTKYICRKDSEQTNTLVDHCDSKASCVEQRLGARKHCNVEVWILMNLMGMNLVAGVECCVQQPRNNIERKETVNVALKVWKRLTV